MGIYRIAQLNIKITPQSEYVKKILSDYETESENVDFEVSVSREDVLYEREVAEKAEAEAYFSEPMCESTAIYRKICNEVLQKHNGTMLHCAAVGYKGKAYIFTAPSGTGKSTHIRLWKKLLGDQVKVINGDKPIVRVHNGEVIVYGTPWRGKEGYGCNTSAPLGGVFLLGRGEVNSVEKAPVQEAVKVLLTQMYTTKNKDDMQKILAIIEKIIVTAPVFRLKCNMDISAAETALSAVEE